MLELLAERRADIERVLREHGWLAKQERVDALTPAGEGNMNRTLRARIGTRSLILKQSVPFVAKYPQIAAPAERIVVEAAFYAAVRSIDAIAGRMPNVVGFDPENRLLALEDLGAAADFTDVYRAGADTAAFTRHIPALLSWLSALHRVTAAGETFDNRAMRTLNHAHIFEIPFAADNGLDLDAITPGLAAIARSTAADDRLKQKVARLGEIYLGQRSTDSAPALLHGDFYPGSWLHDRTKGVRIIDPEFAFVGSTEFDVGVFIAHLLFAGVDHADHLHHYTQPARFSMDLARAFAGVEVLRRLLGVAQLPLTADLAKKRQWIERAAAWVHAT